MNQSTTRSTVNGQSSVDASGSTKSQTQDSLTIHLKSHDNKSRKAGNRRKLSPVVTERKNHLAVPLECDQCHKVFNNRHDYICHIRLHNPNNTKRCAYCHYSASTDDAIQIHIQSLHPKKCDAETEEPPSKRGQSSNKTISPFSREIDVEHLDKTVECSVCQKEIPDSWMEIHLHSHVRTEWLRCKLCDYVSRRQDLMNLHVEKVHATVYGRPDRLSSKTTPIRTGYKECPTCKMVMHKKNLPFHRRSHDPLKLFQCDHCGYATALFLVFQRHLATHAATRKVISDDDEDEPTTSSIDSSLPVGLEQQKEAGTDGSSSSEEGDDESDRFETRRKTRGRGSVQCRICQKIVSVRDLYQHLQIHDPTKLVDFAYFSHIADKKLGPSSTSPSGSGLVSSKPVQKLEQEKTQKSLMSSGVSSLDSSSDADAPASVSGSATMSLNFAAIGEHLSAVFQSRFKNRK